MSRPVNIGEVRAILREEIADTARARRTQTGRLRRILKRILAELNPGRDRMRELEQLRQQVLHGISRRMNFQDGWAQIIAPAAQNQAKEPRK
jgi:hypothetical protein